MEIEVLKEDFSVCKVADFQSAPLTDDFCFLGKTDEECSLVCATGSVPEHTLEREDGWKAFRLKGVLDFSLIGILSKIAALLAEKEISIFAVSTYNTDYVLVKAERFAEAQDALKGGGYTIVPAAKEQDPKEQEPPWKVTYEGSFWSDKGRAGKEIPVKRTFSWGGECWYVPAVYVCGKGLVVDFCKEADPEALKAFIGRWNLLEESGSWYSRRQQERIEREHPLHADFEPQVILNGKELQREHGCSVSWIPASCLNEEIQVEMEAKRAAVHYGLDLSRGWSIYRWSFLWAGKRAPALKSLVLSMKRRPELFSGDSLGTLSAGDTVDLVHPSTAARYTLAVQTCEPQQIGPESLPDNDMEYPSNFVTLAYTLNPELSEGEFMLRDSGDGDRRRRKKQAEGPSAPEEAASIGIIGGADGPTAIFLAGKNPGGTHMAYSSLYFEPQPSIEWYPCFWVKTMEDIEVVLI